MKLNAYYWLFLILLTILGVTVSGMCGRGIILGAAFLKSGLEGWRFMELCNAHRLWKGIFLILISGVFGLMLPFV